MNRKVIRMSNRICVYVCGLIVLFATSVHAINITWEDILNSDGTNKSDWADSSETKKAGYLELYHQAISYCSQNIGKAPKDLQQDIIGPRVSIFYKVTQETIAMLYREYGDLRKAADIRYNYWVSSQGSPELMNADENPSYFVIAGFEEATMYTNLARFYPLAYKALLERYSQFTSTITLHSDFAEFKRNWPKQADEYQEFMHGWAKAKKLAKTARPKPLDLAVQHHEWFYSDKQEEVLKALAYYHTNKVQFMLEKALKHKDPVLAAKAKEYLDMLSKSKENEKKSK